jgi:hypothetical protein
LPEGSETTPKSLTQFSVLRGRAEQISIEPMIFPGGRTCNATWFYITALLIILCLAFFFYQAETRPAHPDPPKTPPMHDAK